MNSQYDIPTPVDVAHNIAMHSVCMSFQSY